MFFHPSETLISKLSIEEQGKKIFITSMIEFVEAGGTNRIESIECLSLFSLEGRNYPCERL